MRRSARAVVAELNHAGLVREGPSDGFLGHVRIPTKKIIHSELKTITASPGDAVGIIVEQVIVMGQEESGDTVSIISFLPFLRSLLAQSLLEHATARPSF